ncbi:MAG: hypothetical protein AAFX87_05015 [Bacteroidota bacterium]
MKQRHYILILFVAAVGSFSFLTLPDQKDELLMQDLLEPRVALNLTDSGYVVHHPCKGKNHTFKRSLDTLVIGWKWEDTKHRISTFEKVNDNTYHLTVAGIYLDHYGLDKRFSPFRVEIKTFDKPHYMELWTFAIDWEPREDISAIYNYKFLLTPESESSNFPLLSYDCIGGNIPVVEFLPIELD